MNTKFLGSNEKLKYASGSFKILDPIKRNTSSNEVYGLDYWNAYEFSFLDTSLTPNMPSLKVLTT